MDLYLCEKPSQAKDLAQVLRVNQRQQGYFGTQQTLVTWCIGHLLEQCPPDAYAAKWKRWSVASLPIEPDVWKLSVKPKVKAQFNVVKRLLKRATAVYIATDGDREGELLAREVLTECRFQGQIHRVWLTALDAKSIQKALNNVLPGEQTESLYHAGLGRARADWLVGMNLTRLFTCSTGADKPLTVGRVQTPTLRLIVDRDAEIAQFTSTDYFELWALFRNAAAAEIKAKWQVPKADADDAGHCLAVAKVKAVRQAVDGQSGVVSALSTRRQREYAPLLFSLSSLQQFASHRFNFSAEHTLKIAQALYEKHKATTYPRSDSQYLPEEQRTDVSAVLAAMLATDPSLHRLIQGADAHRQARCFNTKKVTAHHAIIPTATQSRLQVMSADERKLYQSIRDRYLAQFYPDFEYDETRLSIQVGEHVFTTVGKVTIQMGWKVVIPAREKGTVVLPSLVLNEPLAVIQTAIQALKTKPPAHYTEGTLIAAMKNVARFVADPVLKKVLRENAGIGTEATRAAIIKHLIERRFVQVERKKFLLSSPAGQRLIALLPDQIKDPATTAFWEQKLDDVVARRLSLEQFLTEQKHLIQQMVADVKGQPKGNRVMTDEQTNTMTADEQQHECPSCGKPLQRRDGKYGPFWGCTGYPECRTILNDVDNQPVPKADKQAPADLPEQADDEAETCPLCEKPMRRRQGGHGYFWGCSGYPECKATLPDEQGKAQARTPPKVTKFSCPQCEAKLVLRGPKENTFFGCERYPKCAYTADVYRGKPAVFNCPQCQAILKKRKGKNGFFWGCSGFPTCRFSTDDEAGKPAIKADQGILNE